MTQRGTIETLELSGLTVERPMQTGSIWSPPVVGFEDGCLIYNAASRQKCTPRASMLTSFSDLETTDEASIVKFAKQWGALGIGEDGWPIEKLPLQVFHRESVSSWRLLAGKFRALINIAAEFNQGRPGFEADWTVIDVERMEAPGNLYFPPWTVNYPLRDDLQSAIAQMIRRFRVAPRFWWNAKTDQWRMDLDADGLSNLPGILVIQAMLLIADKEGFAICSNCHRSYIPWRKPDPTRRNYCQRDDCHKLAAWRDAARERRKKIREERGHVKTRSR